MFDRLPMLLIATLTLTVAAVAPAQSEIGDEPAPRDPRYGLLTPLPDRGGVPPIVDMLRGPTPDELARRARSRGYEQQIRRIRFKHFGRTRNAEIRAEGFRQLGEFTDPAAFRPMLEVLTHEQDDVRLAVLDHLQRQGDEGQAALAWAAIMLDKDALRHEAMKRMVTPPAAPVLRVLDQALRSRTHAIANNAGMLAGTLGALETIPLLIFAQATDDPRLEQEGDLAWIAIQTQRAYVADLQAVVGDGAGAFQPIVGIVSEGIVLRVTDAVVIVYRTEIHIALVSMTTRDWGQPTDHLGYDMRAWWKWFNEEYVPFKNGEGR